MGRLKKIPLPVFSALAASIAFAVVLWGSLIRDPFLIIGGLLLAVVNTLGLMWLRRGETHIVTRPLLPPEGTNNDDPTG